MHFLRRITKNFRNNQEKRSAGEAAVNSLKDRLLNKFGKSIFLLIGGPFLLIFVVSSTLIISFGNKVEYEQLVDPGSGSSTNVGNINYTAADFEECVKTSNSATNSGNFSKFQSTLTNTEWKNLSGFNTYIKNKVNAAGYGTVAGVISAAMAFACDYSKATGYKYFYTYPGNGTLRYASQEGIDSRACSSNSGTCLDCRAFVYWALYNGGFKATQLDYITGIKQMGTVKKNVRDVKPGDIFSTDGFGHIWLVVGVYDDGYYAAEEYSGLEINKYSFANAKNGYDAKLYDMSGYYSNSGNVR